MLHPDLIAFSQVDLGGVRVRIWVRVGVRVRVVGGLGLGSGFMVRVCQ